MNSFVDRKAVSAVGAQSDPGDVILGYHEVRVQVDLFWEWVADGSGKGRWVWEGKGPQGHRERDWECARAMNVGQEWPTDG